MHLVQRAVRVLHASLCKLEQYRNGALSHASPRPVSPGIQSLQTKLREIENSLHHVRGALAADVGRVAELLCAITEDPHSPYEEALGAATVALRRHADLLRYHRHQLVILNIRETRKRLDESDEAGVARLPPIEALSTSAVATWLLANFLQDLYLSALSNR